MKQDYSNQDNDLRGSEFDLFDLEKAGYWKSEYSGKWYEKVYKDNSKRIYNWVPVGDEKAIECLEEGMVPSYAAVEEMIHD